jgi:hypothetical protein
MKVAPVLEATGGSDANDESLKPNDERNPNGGMKNEKRPPAVADGLLHWSFVIL